MKIRCGICDKQIEVDDSIVDGQHVLCPFCGNKSTYSKPSRIELPTGVRMPRQSQQNQAGHDTEVPKSSEVHIIKPAHGGGSSNWHDQQKIRIAEDRAKFYQDLRNAESRRKALQNIVSIIAMLGLVAVGIFAFVYLERRKDEATRAQLAFEREREQQRIEREAHDKAVREKDAAEAKAKRERRIAEEKAERERREAERVRNETETRNNRELYKEALTWYETRQFDFLQNLPTNVVPGKTDGDYYYLQPFNDDKVAITQVSVSNGTVSAFRLFEDGTKTIEQADAFYETLASREYLMINGDKVYFRSNRAKAHVAQLPKDKVVDLRDALFGTMAEMVKNFDFDFETVKFEIAFVPNDSKTPIISEVIDYGMTYSLEKVREAVEDAFPPSATRQKVKKSKAKFKRTVAYWDGAHIKRGIDGITYVPHTPPAAAYQDRYSRVRLSGAGWDRSREWKSDRKDDARAEQIYDHWQSLCKEAEKQDCAERQFYENAESSSRAELARLDEIAKAKYQRRIDTIMEKGRLFWRVKPNNKKEAYANH